MARYVKKGGTGSGTSWADAYGSIATAVYNYDGTVHIGRGVYNETGMEWGDSGGSTSTLNIYGHGEVIIDGAGGSYIECFRDPYDDGYDSHIINVYDVTFRNFPGSVFNVITNGGGLEYISIRAYRCKFINCGHVLQPTVGASSAGSQRYSFLKLVDCICDNLTTICSIPSSNGFAGPDLRRPKVYLEGNIFYNCDKIITDNGWGASNVVGTNNINVDKDMGNIYYNVGTLFESSQYPIEFGGTTWGTNLGVKGHVDNFYYDVTNYIVDSSGTVSSLSGLQSYADNEEGWSGAYDNCYTTNPLPATYGNLNNLLSWQENSPVWSNVTTYATRFGPIEFSHAMSDSYQSDGTWTLASNPASGLGTSWAMIDPSHNSITKIDGGFEGSGIIVSPVIDFDKQRRIKKINFVAKEDSPTHVIDSSNSAPAGTVNKQEVEYRISSTSFNQNDASIPWVTTLANEDITGSGLYGRYVQIKLTQRNDGVGG
tara:strand:- start:2373 stop:3824 length:1452 start_codon:yes stop_codon:yes gene_type:complete